MEISPRKLTGKAQPDLFSAASLPGSMSDGARIRAVLVDSIRTSSKSRQQIADEMTVLAGSRVTERMLNGYTAESRSEYRWPAELTRAFCAATNDDRLLTILPELAGLRVITAAEADLLELGRNYLVRKEAEQKMSDIERRHREGAGE